MFVAPTSAAPVYSYFPTGDVTDGKMLRVAGDGLQTLSGTSVTVSFSVDDTIGRFNVGFFDGAVGTPWDQSTTDFPTRYTLYADPLGNGTGTTVVATWTDATMAENAWTDMPVDTSAAARAPSGNYFYRLSVTATNPAISAGNSFKVRVEGYTYIIPTTVFGYIGAYPLNNDDWVYPNWPTLTPTTYDGLWTFYMNVAEDTTYIDLWDGDFDVTNDTDDPNTSAIPPFAPSPPAVLDAARAGNPADDIGTTAEYRRTPNIRYDVVLPDGATTYANTNPSGNTEWELFRLDTTTNNPAVADHRPAVLPAGMYEVRVSGVDMHNLNALRFEHPIVGVDANGRPMPPPAPFLVGDRVWNDADRNGTQEASETGIPGVVVSLLDKTTGSVLAAATTDADGVYAINSWPGTFDIEIDPANYGPGGALEGYEPTVPDPARQRVTVTTANLTTVDFGLWSPPPPPGVDVTPDRSGSITPSSTIDYTFSVINGTGIAGIFDLTTMSSMGWAGQIRSVSGATITSVTLASGETTSVVVRVSVPSTATVGTQDVTLLTARQRGAPTVADTASGTTTVMNGLLIMPDETGSAGPGSFIMYTHTITNSWPTTRTVSVNATPSLAGWTTQLFDTDGVTPITSVAVGPYGATRDIVVRVNVPAGATNGQVCTTVVTASAPTGGGTQSDSASDVTTVRRLNTYDTNTYANLADTFTRGDRVYARATGLTSSWNVYFRWRDPSGQLMRQSPTVAATGGQATDSYPTGGTDPTGGWTVEIWRDRTTDTIIDAPVPFDVVHDAEVTRVTATDAPGIGDDVAVTAAVFNHAPSQMLDTTLTYVIWWDENGDGAFGAGDTYIDPSGAPQTWNGSTPVSTHVTTGVDVAGTSPWTQPPWTVDNSLFPHRGDYNVTVTWTQSDGFGIDEKTGSFYAIPVLGWPLLALSVGLAAVVAWRKGAFIGPAAARW